MDKNIKRKKRKKDDIDMETKEEKKKSTKNEANNKIKSNNSNGKIEKTSVKEKNYSQNNVKSKPMDTIVIRDTSQDTKVFEIVKTTRPDGKKEIIYKEKGTNNSVKNNESYNIKKNIPVEKKENVVKSGKDLVKEAQRIVDEQVQKEKKTEINKKKNEEKIKKENKKEANSAKRKNILFLLLFILVIFILIIFSTIFALINKNSDKIIEGIYINNINVSNMTKSEAINKLNEELNNNIITVKYKDYAREVKLQDIDGNFNVEDVVSQVYEKGRENNLIQNNYKILKNKFFHENVGIKLVYDEKKLQDVINQISIELPDVAVDSSYVINGEDLVIKNSKEGIQIQTDRFRNYLISAFMNRSKVLDVPVEQCEKKKIDIEAIHNEVYKEPENAYYTTEPHAIYKEQDGLDFAISLDEAKKIISEEKDEYVIKLKVLKPQIRTADLDSGAFPDKLGVFTTNYSMGDLNRNHNIALAAKSISNVVLMPGEEFSYNDLIGECSIKTGYKESTIYLNGELSRGVGGGICQVATTLYNAVLRANLEIVERKNHSLGATYVPAGQDAMVSIGTQNFKFKNNREYPIRVIAKTGPGNVTCEIEGLKQDVEYEVKLQSNVISRTDTKYKVETYKILYLNGVEVSRTWLSTDTYKNH